ncbi:hypothetical protein GCM10028814_01720 [Angustibacter aerolatus]
MSPADERTWATLAHVAPFAGGFVGLPLLGPLGIWLAYKDRSPWVRHHAASALNFQLVLLLVFAVGTVLSVVVGVLTLGIGLLVVVPLLLVVALVGTGYQVVAAVVTSRGQDFRYPLTPQWVR